MEDMEVYQKCDMCVILDDPALLKAMAFSTKVPWTHVNGNIQVGHKWEPLQSLGQNYV